MLLFCWFNSVVGLVVMGYFLGLIWCWWLDAGFVVGCGVCVVGLHVTMLFVFNSVGKCGSYMVYVCVLVA